MAFPETALFVGSGWATQIFGPDVEFYATIDLWPDPATPVLSLDLRASSTTGRQTCYELQATTTGLYLYGFENAIGALIGSWAHVMATGDSIGVRAVGNQITVHFKTSGGNWSEVITAIDNRLNSAGYLVIMGEGDLGDTPTIVSPGGGDLGSTPVNLTASPVDIDTIVLNWQGGGTYDTLTIERSPDGVTFGLLDTLTAGIFTYTDDGLSNSTLYFYRMRVHSDNGDSDYSTIASARTLGTTKMALIKRLDGNASDLSAIDLFAHLARDGYQPDACDEGATTVEETITVHLDEALIPEMDLKIREAAQGQSALDVPGVWLRIQTPREPAARQAFLKRIARPTKMPTYGLIARDDSIGKLPDLTYGIQRIGAWEATTLDTLTGVAVSTLGGGMSYTIPGDLAARLYSLELRPQVQPALNLAIDEVWLGAKTERLGNPAGFQPVWDLTDATLLGDDTTIGGGVVTCTFSGVRAMAPRVYITLEDAIGTSDPDDQRGQYLVLLRCRVTGTLKANLQLASGVYGTGQWRSFGHEQVENAYQNFHSLAAQCWIPPTYIGDLTPSQFAFRISAEALSGSGTLIMDRLVLIPSLEGALHFKTNVTARALADLTRDRIVVYTRPDGTLIGTMRDGVTNALRDIFHPDGVDWGLSVQGQTGRLIVAAHDTTANDTANYLTAEAQYYSRYLTRRGA